MILPRPSHVEQPPFSSSLSTPQMPSSSSSSSTSSSLLSDRELEVASILQRLPDLLQRSAHLCWATKKRRTSHRKPLPDPSSTSSPVSPLLFPPAKKDRVKDQARSIARLRQANQSLQQEAASARIRFEALLAENFRLKEIRSRAAPPRFWTLAGICDASVRHVAVRDERRNATAEARRRRMEIKRRKKGALALAAAAM